MIYKEFWEEAKSYVNKSIIRGPSHSRRPEASRIRDWRYSLSRKEILFKIDYSTESLTPKTFGELKEKVNELGLKISPHYYHPIRKMSIGEYIRSKLSKGEYFGDYLDFTNTKGRKAGNLDCHLGIKKNFEQGGELLEAVMEIKPSEK